MKATRVFQLTALALVVVSAVQVGYWLYDQQSRAMDRVNAERTHYLREVVAAQSMLDAGVVAARVRQVLPDQGRRPTWPEDQAHYHAYHAADCHVLYP